MSIKVTNYYTSITSQYFGTTTHCSYSYEQCKQSQSIGPIIMGLWYCILWKW